MLRQVFASVLISIIAGALPSSAGPVVEPAVSEVMHPWTYAAKTPDKPALIMADSGESLSYAQLMRRANQCAHLLRALGCSDGDTIAIFSRNNLTYPELCWAAKDSGLHYACVSSALNADDAAYVVGNSDAKILLVSHDLREVAAQVAAKIDPQVKLLMFGGTTDGFSAYEPLRDAQPDTPLANARRGASMLYSSGTTGRPKGVRTTLTALPPTTPPLRHQLLIDNFGFGNDTVFIDSGPFYHAAPLRKMMTVQRLGGTVVAFEKFDAETALRAIERYRATHAFFVPTMLIRMLRLPDEVKRSVDTSSLRCAIHTAAPITIETKDAMMAWWGPVLYELYGGTEGCGHTFISPQEWLRKKGSVGKPAEGCRVRIVDEQGKDVGRNVPGLIYMGNGRAFAYYKDEAKTADANDAEGLTTIGDIGYLDDDGYLFLTDRRAHMIISGGVNIYPQEAENVLAGHPAIADVAVIGVPHAEFGEEVKAVVQTKMPVADAKALEAEIIAWCRARLSPIKCPRSVDFVDELPRNEAGKLVKRLIKDRYWQGRTTRIV